MDPSLKRDCVKPLDEFLYRPDWLDPVLTRDLLSDYGGNRMDSNRFRRLARTSR